METKPQSKVGHRQRSPKEKEGKRYWVSNVCVEAMDHLKRETGFRSSNDLVHWLIRRVRPELLPENPQEPFHRKKLAKADGSRKKSRSVRISEGGKCSEKMSEKQKKPESAVKSDDRKMKPPAPAAKPAQSVKAVAVRVAVVQASTLFFDTPRTLDKVERLVACAASYGTQLVVFPEAFVGGHPCCFAFDPKLAIYSADMETEIRKYVDSTIKVPGLEVDRLGKIASSYKVHLVVGVVERARSNTYSTVLIFDSGGQLLGQHRKQTLATYERAIWKRSNKPSSPSCAIYETSIGKIGVVIGGDNILPHLVSEFHAQGVQIHCAPTADSGDVWKGYMTRVAKQNCCFVLSANQFCKRTDQPLSGLNPACSRNADACFGGSMIVSPSGTIVAGPNQLGECVIPADIELNDILPARKENVEAKTN